MLKEHSRLILRAHKILDICLTTAAFIGSYFIRMHLLPAPLAGLITLPNYYVVLFMIIIIWYITFDLFGLYGSYRQRSFWRVFLNMAKAVSTGMLALTLCMYLLKITDVSRIMLGIFLLLDIGLLGLSKGLVYRIIAHYRQKGFNFRNVLIIGCEKMARDVIDAIGDRLGSGYRVLGCLGLEQNDIGRSVKNGVGVIGTVDHLEKILMEDVVDEVVCAMPLSSIGNVDKHLAFAESMGVAVRIVPDWQIENLMYRPGIARIDIEDFLGIPTMALSTTSANQIELLLKSVLDYTLAGIAFILLSPLFLLICCAIKISSRGPVFFRQERCGLNGRRFIVLKFRTMVADAEKRRNEIVFLNEMDGPVFKIKKDPRIIPFIGTILRKTSLDEVPQLINVLKGEMSLIGPRPPIPVEVEKYEIWQRRRLSMKPGITCLWQCTQNRNQVCFADWMKMDLEYIDDWSLKLDCKIMLKTAVVMATGAGR